MSAWQRPSELGRGEAAAGRVGRTGRCTAPGVRRRPGHAEMRGRILTVDWEEGSLNATAGFVHRLGFEVELATGPDDLLGRLRERAPDVVLVDVLMPGMSGFTLADRIAAAHPGVPVLLASRYDHRPLTAERRPASVVGFLQKPVEVRELGVALEQAMAGARAPRVASRTA